MCKKVLNYDIFQIYDINLLYINVISSYSFSLQKWQSSMCIAWMIGAIFIHH